MKSRVLCASIDFMDDSRFLIACGGIAGLATALGLSNIGRPSHVLERATELDPLGAGLQLGPNAVRALQQLGAWDALEPHCASPAEIHIRDGISGKLLQRVDLGQTFVSRFGAPYRVALRHDLHKALYQVAISRADIEVELGAEVTG